MFIFFRRFLYAMSSYHTHETIVSGRYRFVVFIDEDRFEGVPNGRMDEMPGNFLKAVVRLIEVENPSPLEALAAEKRVVLDRFSKEITSEPPGYAELWGTHYLETLAKDPAWYVRDLQKKVKDAL
jgi:hypothetical protein